MYIIEGVGIWVSFFLCIFLFVKIKIKKFYLKNVSIILNVNKLEIICCGSIKENECVVFFIKD